MRGYINILSNAVQRSISYRIDVYFILISRVIGLLVQISIWRALFSGEEYVSYSGGVLSIQEIVTYMMLSAFLSLLINTRVTNTINDKIKTGEIAMDMIKPLNFKYYMIFDTIGYNLFLILFQVIPLSLLALLFFKITLPSIPYMLLFVVSVINGMIINFIMEYVIGVMAFWFIVSWPLQMLHRSLVKVFSGIWIPIWFFTDSVQAINDILPFKYIFFTSASIFLEKLTFHEAYIQIFIQYIWIIVLVLAERFIWNKGLNRLIIQGG
ncbi:ABC-2 family transporter protein [Paenibacillus typhae]|nr:ABC-2 family transporter protein [Paenibacillus typhae]